MLTVPLIIFIRLTGPRPAWGPGELARLLHTGVSTRLESTFGWLLGETKRNLYLNLSVFLNQLDFLGGSVVKESPANAGDMVSIPGLEGSHRPRS